MSNQPKSDENEPQEPDSELTAKQEALIAALLVAPTQEEAAASVGIHRSTMYSWLRDETFKDRLKSAKRALWDHSMTRLQGVTSEAVDALRFVMADSTAPASAKVTAARTVLEFAKNNIELADLEERLKALEIERITNDDT